MSKHKPVMKNKNPCEKHLYVETGGYCPFCLLERCNNLTEDNALLRGVNEHISQLLTKTDFSLITVEEFNNMCKELKKLQQHNRELKGFLKEIGKRVGGNTETIIEVFLETGGFEDE